MTRALALLVLVACSDAELPGPSVSAALDRPVSELKLTPAEWSTVVVEPYRAMYGEYERAFDAAAPVITAQVEASKAKPTSRILTRAHYAGDPKLTRGQARARWALPVQAPAQVVVLDDAPIDAVFVRVRETYKAIVGVDQIVIDHTRALDAACAPLLEMLGSKACQTIGWEIADASLRSDRKRLAHACSLATSQCAR